MAILFDLDGVLANSRDTIVRSVNQAFVALGHGARPETEIEWIIGPPTEIAFGTLLGADPASAVVVEAVAAYREIYVDAIPETPSFPGVPETVRKLEGPLGVATSKPLRFATPTLEAIGLLDAFTVVAGPVPGGPGDKRTQIVTAMETLPDAHTMVGDRRYDIEAARGLGLYAIGVTWGFGSREELEAAGADEIVDTPDQLLEAATRASRSTRR